MVFSAETVLEQLGGNKFIVMTGANTFVKGRDYIRFKLPRARNSIKYVTIKLTPLDTYDVIFQKSKGQIVRVVHNVYWDMLQDIFTKYTGLHTRL